MHFKQKKSFVFKLMGIALPFLFLVVFECALRIFNYGDSLHLFIPYDVEGQYLMFNPKASQRYFNNPRLATKGNKELFKKDKDARTFRIFVLGESTTIGYPYFHNGSFHRWLQYRLMQTFPEKNFEIINLSLTAVNSYTILGFSNELLAYKPDAVLIYVGHNEYYGAMGVGSSQFTGDFPWLVNLLPKMRKLRLVQLVSNGYSTFQRHLKSNEFAPDASRMELMVSRRHIPLGSDMYSKGLQQFKTNLKKTLALFNSKNIPVFIGNLVSNEKDLVPFISTSDEEIENKEFFRHYQLGNQALQSGALSNALTHFEKANGIFSNHAECNYYLGILNYDQNDSLVAKKFYNRAKELDELRFRAPNQNNEIIASLAHEYDNTYLVDIKNEFINHSKTGILGKDLLIDHVHPNLMGFALMSNTYYDAIMSSKILPPVDDSKTMSFETLLTEMPISSMDSIYGEYIILTLKANWPYNETEQKQKIESNTFEQRLAAKMLHGEIGWRHANDSLYAYYSATNQLEKALKVAEAMVLEYAEDPVFYDKAGALSMNLHQYELASFYLTKSFHLRPSVTKSKYLSIHFLKWDKPKLAMPFLDYTIAFSEKDKSIFIPISKMTEDIVKLKSKLNDESSIMDAAAIENEIAEIYLKMNNRDAAKKYLEIVLGKDAHNEKALAMLNVLNQTGYERL